MVIESRGSHKLALSVIKSPWGLMAGPKTPMPRIYLLHPHVQVMATALHPLEPKNAKIG